MASDGTERRFVADHIAACCLSVYDGLPKKGAKPGVRSDGRWEWTILAGAVLQNGQELHCISLATGVKVLPYQSLSKHGDLLHDSHAEVLARRGARTWLLKRLALEVGNDEEAFAHPTRLFTKNAFKRWRLSAGVRLHLYCSTFPCEWHASYDIMFELIVCKFAGGDASNFLLPQAHQPLLVDGTIEEHNIKRGRSGTSQSSAICLRTKPGKLQSLPSISMSCTDKISLWSVVGMQGSLLSEWIEPIYFDQVIIGLEGTQHVYDATAIDTAANYCQSVFEEKVGSLHSCNLKVLTTTIPFSDSRHSVQGRLLQARPSAKVSGPSDELDLVPAAGSLVWIMGEGVERIVEGKRQGAALPRRGEIALSASTRSRISKRSYYDLFQQCQTVLASADVASSVTYYEAKHKDQDKLQVEYRRRKEALRGCTSNEENDILVERFLNSAKRDNRGRAKSVVPARAKSRPDAPFLGWLVAGRRFESFPCT